VICRERIVADGASACRRRAHRRISLITRSKILAHFSGGRLLALDHRFTGDLLGDIADGIERYDLQGPE